MIFKWETDRERLLKFLRITPKAKMEWLLAMNVFVYKASSKRMRKLRVKRREKNSLGCV